MALADTDYISSLAETQVLCLEAVAITPALVALSFLARKTKAIFLAKQPPNAPTDLTLVTVSDEEIQVSWTDNTTEETGSRFGAQTTMACDLLLITTTAADATSYNDTPLGVNALLLQGARRCIAVQFRFHSPRFYDDADGRGRCLPHGAFRHRDYGELGRVFAG